MGPGAGPGEPVPGGGVAAPVGQTVGEAVRSRRLALGLTLEEVGRRAGCAKSYLSTIEGGKRGKEPSEAVLRRLESALGLRGESLVELAAWERAPAGLKRELSRLAGQRVVAERLSAILGRSRVDAQGRPQGGLDEAYKAGEVQALLAALGGGSRERGVEAAPVRALLPREVPVINSVAAGYPREFTDLGYPARVADSYVRCPDLDDPDAFAARVVGDSMSPQYVEGDIVIFSPAAAVKAGSDCLARLEPDHETTFKRVFFDVGPGGEELIRLQPLNPAYAARVLPREEVAGLYAAVTVMRKVGG